MQKCFFFGFTKPGQISAVLQLQNEGLIEVPLWCGTSKVCNLQHRKISTYIELTNNIHSGHPLPWDEDYWHVLVEFQEMFSRNYRVSKGLSPQEIWHIVHIYYDYFAGLLLEHDIDVVVFNTIPHDIEGILYRVAKKLEVKTLICYQSLFSNRFFFCWDRDDFGYFRHIKPISENPELKIGKGYETNLFWSKDISPLKPRNIWDIVAIPLVQELGRRLRKVSQPRYFRRPKRTLAGLLQNYHESREFIKAYRKLAVDSVNYTEQYVYFALHLQPEVSTSGSGDPYFDQLLAIEYLAGILPRDWKIYVKEHPRQGVHAKYNYQHRSTYFYWRLRRLPQAVYLSREISNYDLMRYSQFVSTITGTAGWEAIKGGKPVLIFGPAWYASLPGVFRFRPNMDVKEILACRIEHAELEKRLNELLMKAGVGVLDREYSQDVQDYSDEQNSLYLQEFFRKVLS